MNLKEFSKEYKQEPIIKAYKRYNTLIKKQTSRENFIKERERLERNNFGLYSYTLIEDVKYNKITQDLDNYSNELRKRLGIAFI